MTNTNKNTVPRIPTSDEIIRAAINGATHGRNTGDTVAIRFPATVLLGFFLTSADLWMIADRLKWDAESVAVGTFFCTIRVRGNVRPLWQYKTRTATEVK